MAAATGILYITYVEKQGPFLKIWGQTDKNLPSIIEKSLKQMTIQFDQGLFMPVLDSIQNGILCCAKYKDGCYYRARVTNMVMIQQQVVEVQFVDYGNKEIIPVINLRTIASFAPGLITIPPQAKEHILANITHHGPAWDNNAFTVIVSEIRYMDLPFMLVGQLGNFNLIKLFKNGEDVALNLFNRGLVLSIATNAQNMILQSTGIGSASPSSYQVSSAAIPPAIPSPITPTTPPVTQVISTPPALLAYKAFSIESNTDNEIYVSYVSDGPCQFSVQLKRMEDSLARLMKELNRMPLQPLEDDPLPGTVCVARCLEDDHICRAVVTSMVDGQYKVFYVDFGNTELVPIDNLYQIPFKYVIPKVMAIRYALAGLERSSVTIEMKCAFKEFVSDKLLHMHTLPPPTIRSALPICSLRDSNNVNVLDVLQRAALLAYPEAIQLTRGFSQEVRVSYVHSCSHFYVQIIMKEEELRKVMAELQVNCPNADPLLPTQIKTGQPCCALFDADGQWYRAEIISSEGDIVTVRYVDYGNEEQVSTINLRMPRGELLTALRPQALECCLNGYQNMEDDLERDNILEELILEKEFTMKVIEMQGNRALVQLNNQSRYNVGSLLLERLASARSQVSPLLIQDSHHIEQRKRSSPTATCVASQNYRLERKSSRDQNDKSWGNTRQTSFEKDQNSPKQTSNDKGWNKRQDSSEKVWNNRQDSNEKVWNNRQDSNEKSWNNRQDSGEKSWNNRQDSSEKSWNNRQDSGEKGWNNKQDSWRQTKSPRKDDNSDRGRGDSFDQGRGRRDGFKKDNNWGGDEPQWKKNARSPKEKESSEKSWSDGSEKNWRRSNRAYPQNDDKRPRHKPDSGGRGDSWKSSTQDNTFSSDNNVAKVMDPAPHTATFTVAQLTGTSEKVHITWFHNPSNFFCQLQGSEAEFRSMMNEIQDTYCKIKPESVPVGSPAIALYPDDGVRYRVRVLEVQGLQYRVQFVDFGNTSKTDQVWPIENKFMKLPTQAICCGLNGIVSPENGWPNTDSFSTYFNKDSFTCVFVSSETDKYLVDLTCDEQSICEVLVSAGLVAYQDYGTQLIFDPAVLLGQQMRVVVGEIQGLDSFYVYLPNEQYLLCTMHNLESATQTSEDILKQQCGSVVIIYVDNVLEKTEVTLYDRNGTKLNIIEPDEGAFETVEVLCPLPVLYSTLNGWISHLAPSAEEKRHAFIQPSEFADTLAQLLEDLFNHYDTASVDTPIEPEVSSTYAVHSSDGNWYRGQVTNVEGETITVTFIDYGNSESVSNTELRELDIKFIEQHMLALEVVASGIDETFTEQEITANVWYGETGWEAEILKAGQTQTEPLPAEEEASAIVSQEQPVQPTEDQAAPEVVPGEQASQIGVPVILSHVDSPSEFYLQLSEALAAIDNVQATLQEQAESFPDLENPAAGVLCAAPYSLDQQWYRAQVLDADSDITTVRFVDYGNTDVLSNDTTHVKTLPSELLSLEQHARRCSLILKSTDAEWSPIACERFETLTNFENLTAEIKHQEEKTTYVELYASGLNVAEVLLQENLAVKLQLEMESSCTGYVSNLNSPSEFWVQLENSVADLEWIAEQLSNTENFPELEDLAPGSLCAALFSEDEMWYRARILSNTVAGLEVLFIDYGNSCTCTGLRQLPEDLIMLPALAQKCSLQKPAGILQWSVEATEEFKNISADGATIFNIDKLTTGETSVVRLLLDGEDISTKLLAKTEDGYISHFESISSFWLQKATDTPKLDAITEKLLDAANWPKYEPKDESRNLVAALYSNDETWYRAKILNEKDSEYEVLFVDYGNTATTNEIRILPCDIEEESPLATKYKLDPLPGFRWNDESSKQLAVISNEGSTLFQVEFASVDIVRLYLNGNDVRTDLDSIGVSSAQNTPKKSVAIKTENIIPHDTEKFLDNDTELLTVTDMKAKDNLVLETSQGLESEKTEKDIHNVEVESVNAANVELVTEPSLSVELNESNTFIENLKNSVDQMAKYEDEIKQFVDTDNEIHITSDKSVEENQEDTESSLVELNKSNTSLDENQSISKDIDEELSDEIKQVKEIENKVDISDKNIEENQEEVGVSSSPVELDESNTNLSDNIENQGDTESSLVELNKSNISLDENQSSISKDIDEELSDEIKQVKEIENKVDISDKNIEENQEEVGVSSSPVELDESNTNLSDNIENQGDTESSLVELNKSNISLDENQSSISKDIDEELSDEIKQVKEIENKVNIISDKNIEENQEEIGVSSSLVEFNDSNTNLNDQSTVANEIETVELSTDEITQLQIENKVNVESDENIEQIKEKDINIKSETELEKVDELAAGDFVKESENAEIDINTQPSGDTVVSLISANTNECNLESPLSASDIIDSNSKINADLTLLQDAETKLTAEGAKVQTNNESSKETKTTDDLENLAQPSKEETPVYISQRRSSTPHSEKIVPGSVCRGDLTEMDDDDDNDQKVVSGTNLSSPETNKNVKCSTPVDKAADEKSSENKELSKNEELSKNISSSTSSCKITLDERIVPGCLSRGETPEPPESETDRIVMGAVNGLEVSKDKPVT